MSEGLIHDTAWKAATAIVGLFKSALREEELRDAFAEVYRVIKDWLRQYEMRAERMQQRLHPPDN